MKNEWSFFAHVLDRLQAGQQLVTARLTQPLTWPPQLQRGIAVDEQGTEYELGDDFAQALETCITKKGINWVAHFQDNTICFGPQATLGIDPEMVVIRLRAGDNDRFEILE